MTTRMHRHRTNFLPFALPCIGAEEIQEVVDTLRSNWLTTGPRTKAFESQFGEFVGAPGDTSLMLNSCTSALLLALAAHGVGPGDEVIVPSLTFAATANVVIHLGARPVLVDVLPDTLCMDPGAAERAVTSATKVIMPVHYAGHPADLNAIDEVALRHGLAIVEDAAHSAQSWYRGAMIGSRPNLAAFSFYAIKNLTTGEGGALTGPAELLDKARLLSLHGMSKDAWKRFDEAGSWEYDVTVPGYKCNMTDVQAALGKHQLRKLPQFHEHRKALAERYNAAFQRPELITPTEREDVVSSWHLYVLRFRPQHLNISRNAIIEQLKARNIGTSVHYRPLHMMSYYADRFSYRPEDFPVARDAFETMVSLPLNPTLSDGDADDVIAAVLDIVEAHQA